MNTSAIVSSSSSSSSSPSLTLLFKRYLFLTLDRGAIIFCHETFILPRFFLQLTVCHISSNTRALGVFFFCQDLNGKQDNSINECKYMEHIFELRMKDQIEERSSQLLRNLSSCEKKAWKKFRLERDSNPWPLWCRCSALPTELSSQLGAGHIVSSIYLH